MKTRRKIGQMKNSEREHDFIVLERQTDEMTVCYTGEDRDEAVSVFLHVLHQNTDIPGARFEGADVAFTERKHDLHGNLLFVADAASGISFAALRGVSLSEWMEIAPDGMTLS
jgi:hypothetical protein